MRAKVDVPQVDSHIFERSTDAATSVTGGLHSAALVRDFLALPADAGIAAVEDGGCLGASRPSAPVPVLRMRFSK